MGVSKDNTKPTTAKMPTTTGPAAFRKARVKVIAATDSKAYQNKHQITLMEMGSTTNTNSICQQAPFQKIIGEAIEIKRE
jgi:N-methylhydantoinase A/oxoprolinase/acetone carboxylase beta subunit